MSENKSIVTIANKIVSVSVVKPSGETISTVKPEPMVSRVQLTEKVARPESLQGRTYKLKPPSAEHALYLTINDIVLNEGTEYESRQPFEIFLTSKDTKSHQWVMGMTLMISAIFRKGGDVLFIIDELKSVSDPSGGYFSKKAHGIMPSLVAEIGYTIEEHFIRVGIIKPDLIDTEVKQILADVKEDFIAKGGSMDHATVCPKCQAKAVIRLDNCPTCTNCGDSKCG
jgi:hypothetical protein